MKLVRSASHMSGNILKGSFYCDSGDIGNGQAQSYYRIRVILIDTIAHGHGIHAEKRWSSSYCLQ